MADRHRVSIALVAPQAPREQTVVPSNSSNISKKCSKIDLSHSGNDDNDNGSFDNIKTTQKKKKTPKTNTPNKSQHQGATPLARSLIQNGRTRTRTRKSIRTAANCTLELAQ